MKLTMGEQVIYADRTQAFDLADSLSPEESKRFGVPPLTARTADVCVLARCTGAYRRPVKGEWYLSGALVAAYKAPNDLSHEYPIADLVKVDRQSLELLEDV